MDEKSFNLSEYTDDEREYLDSTCGRLRVTTIGTHIQEIQKAINGITVEYDNTTGILKILINGKEKAWINIGIEKYVNQAEIVDDPEGLTEGKYIKLLFEGGADPVFIPTADIGKIYSAGDGIYINSEGLISCTIDPSEFQTCTDIEFDENGDIYTNCKMSPPSSDIEGNYKGNINEIIRKGKVNGVASLDNDGKVPLNELPNIELKQTEPTFIVDSEIKFQKWVDNDPNNDYTHIKIKAGEYGVAIPEGSEPVINLTNTGTVTITGEYGTILNCALEYDDIPRTNDYKVSDITLKYSNINKTYIENWTSFNIYAVGVNPVRSVCRRLRNLTNVRVELSPSSGFYYHNNNRIYGFIGCYNLNNCSIIVNATTKITGENYMSFGGFNRCFNMSNCVIEDIAVNHTGLSDRGPFCFNTCFNLHNCKILNVSGVATWHNRGFHNCMYLYNCEVLNWTSITGNSGNRGQFTECRYLYGCKCYTSGITKYLSCYNSKDNSVTVGNTAVGGWND